jgi:hypothetical protein
LADISICVSLLGSKVLFRIAEGLFCLNEQKILALFSNPQSKGSSTGELFKLLRDIGNDIYDPEVLIMAAYPSYKPQQPNGSMLMLGLGKPIPLTPTGSRPTSASSPSLLNWDLFGFGLGSGTLSSPSPPPSLSGLGLAHLGPLQSLVSTLAVSVGASSASSDPNDQDVGASPSKLLQTPNISKLNRDHSVNVAGKDATGPPKKSSECCPPGEVVNVVPRRPSQELRGASMDPRSLIDLLNFISLSQPPTTGELLEADMSNKMVQQLAVNRSSRASSSSSSSSSFGIAMSSSSPSPSSSLAGFNTFLQSLSASGRRIKRADIQTMRSNYRPELEGRFQMMEITRQQQKEDHLQHVAAVARGEPGSAPAIHRASEDLSLAAMSPGADFDDNESDNQRSSTSDARDLADADGGLGSEDGGGAGEVLEGRDNDDDDTDDVELEEDRNTILEYRSSGEVDELKVAPTG